MSVNFRNVTNWPWPNLKPEKPELNYELSFRDIKGELKKVQVTLTSSTYFDTKYYDVDEDWCVCFQKDLKQDIKDYVTSSAILTAIGIKNPNHTYCVARLVKDTKLDTGEEAMLSLNPAGPKMKDYALVKYNRYYYDVSSNKQILKGVNKLKEDLNLIDINKLNLSLKDVYFAYKFNEPEKVELYVNTLTFTNKQDVLEKYKQLPYTSITEVLLEYTRDPKSKKLPKSEIIPIKINEYSEANLFNAPLPTGASIKVSTDPNERNEELYKASKYPIPNKIRSKALIFKGVNLFYKHGKVLISSVQHGDYLLRFVGLKRLLGFMKQQKLRKALFDKIIETSNKEAFEFLSLNSPEKFDGAAFRKEFNKKLNTLNKEIEKPSLSKPVVPSGSSKKSNPEAKSGK